MCMCTQKITQLGKLIFIILLLLSSFVVHSSVTAFCIVGDAGCIVFLPLLAHLHYHFHLQLFLRQYSSPGNIVLCQKTNHKFMAFFNLLGIEDSETADPISHCLIMLLFL
jgi:hypothetical protein